MNQYLDLFAIHPARHFRINPRKFAYASILPKIKSTSHENLTALVAVLGVGAKRLKIDPSIRDLMDGNPQTNLDLPSARADRLDLLWHIQMAFQDDE